MDRKTELILGALECCAEYPDCDDVECRRETLRNTITYLKSKQLELEKLREKVKESEGKCGSD